MLLARRYAMKLDVWGFGLAVGAVVAAAFTICAFFIAIAPQATTEFIGYLLHINLWLVAANKLAELHRRGCRRGSMDWFVGCGRS
jgi:hypothetical protein